jgi:hypothetical protein
LRGLVLHVLGGDRVERHLEAEFLGHFLEQRNRLLAEAGVEMQEADLLAFQLVDAAFLLADVLDDHRQAVPVGGRRVEHPGEDVAARRGREAVGHGQDRDLVHGRAGDQRQGDAGRPGIDHDRVLALHRFIAFDALLGVVAGLAFLENELHAADAAVALVEHAEIVVHAVRDGDAGPGEGAGAVGEEGHIDRVLREGRQCCAADQGRDGQA